MKYRFASKPNVFLIEMIIVILIFAFCSAIALGLFANAHKLDLQSRNTTIAVMNIQSLAEAAKNSTTISDFMAFARNGENETSSKNQPWPRFYDSSWNEASEDQAVYIIESSLRSDESDSGIMAYIDFKAAEIGLEGTPLFELTIQKYFAQ